jgi:hypothetical protein
LTRGLLAFCGGGALAVVAILAASGGGATHPPALRGTAQPQPPAGWPPARPAIPPAAAPPAAPSAAPSAAPPHASAPVAPAAPAATPERVARPRPPRAEERAGPPTPLPDSPRTRSLAAACAQRGLTEGEVAYVFEIMESFENEVRDLDGAAGGAPVDAAGLVRARSLEVLADLRAALGATKFDHLMSDETLKPIYRFSYSSRPTVYPPPQPDPAPGS